MDQKLKKKIININELDFETLFYEDRKLGQKILEWDTKNPQESILFEYLVKNCESEEILSNLESFFKYVEYKNLDNLINSDGLNILSFCCQKMNLVLLKYFLERRKKLFNLNSKLLDNNTPLHVAVIFEPEGNFNPCLGVLLENGINLNQADAQEGTALHLAIKEQCFFNASYLLTQKFQKNDYLIFDGLENTIFHDLVFHRVNVLWELAVDDLLKNYSEEIIKKVTNQINSHGNKIHHEAAMIYCIEPYFLKFLREKSKELFIDPNETNQHGQTIQQIQQIYMNSQVFKDLQKIATENQTQQGKEKINKQQNQNQYEGNSYPNHKSQENLTQEDIINQKLIEIKRSQEYHNYDEIKQIDPDKQKNKENPIFEKFYKNKVFEPKNNIQYEEASHTTGIITLSLIGIIFAYIIYYIVY